MKRFDIILKYEIREGKVFPVYAGIKLFANSFNQVLEYMKGEGINGVPVCQV